MDFYVIAMTGFVLCRKLFGGPGIRDVEQRFGIRNVFTLIIENNMDNCDFKVVYNI
jgi:hypothetical protein